jgi:hypothetical protein
VAQRTDSSTTTGRPQAQRLLRAVRRLPDGPAQRWLVRLLTRGQVATSRDGPEARAAGAEK